MNQRLRPEQLKRARDQRRTPTQAERRLWISLRRRRMRGFKFRRQHPIGPYIVDFYSHAARLVIEIDGEQHGDDAHEGYDAKRTDELEKQGLRVLRFWNGDVLAELEGVLGRIDAVLDELVGAGDGARPAR